LRDDDLDPNSSDLLLVEDRFRCLPGRELDSISVLIVLPLHTVGGLGQEVDR